MSETRHCDVLPSDHADWRRQTATVGLVGLGLLLVLAQTAVSAHTDLRSSLSEYVSEADAEDVHHLSYVLFEWPWQDPWGRAFLGLFGMSEKPEPPEDPRAELLELVDDSEPDELEFLEYLRRGLEDGQDLAACFAEAEPAPCVSRVMDAADQAALDE